MENYHDIFIPATDIFRLSGPNAFTELGGDEGKRNLVVMPFDIVDQLRDKSSEGGQDTLRKLQDICQTSAVVGREGPITVYRISEGLDLASVDYGANGAKEFSFIELEKTVNSTFTNQNQKPAIITTQPDLDFKLTSRGLRVEEPHFLMVGPDIIHEGLIRGSSQFLATLHQNKGQVPLEQAMDLFGKELYLHQFIYFEGGDFGRVVGDYIKNKSKTRIVDVKDPQVVLLDRKEKGRQLKLGSDVIDNVVGIKPFDMEQYLALQFGLLNPDVELMFLCGGAGSGKTVLSYAAAVNQVLWYNSDARKRRGLGGKGGLYNHIVLLKPFEIVGGKRREVGFLPGTLYDKIKQHLESYHDAHKLSTLSNGIRFEEMFRHPKHANDFGPAREGGEEKKVDGAWLPPNSEVIELTYSGFLRGRSFHNVIVIVDEAQNFTPYEMKTIIGRLGPGCKAIITGDAYDQLDNPLCTREINGLTHCVKEFLPRDYSCLVPLAMLHRSQMAEDAANWKGVYQ